MRQHFAPLPDRRTVRPLLECRHDRARREEGPTALLRRGDRVTSAQFPRYRQTVNP